MPASRIGCLDHRTICSPPSDCAKMPVFIAAEKCDEPRRPLRNAICRRHAHQPLLAAGFRLADASARGGNWELRSRNDHRNRTIMAAEARRDQRRVLRGQARLAGAASFGRHRGRRHRRGHRQGAARGRQRARRADADPRHRAVRVVRRYRRQPGQHAAAAAAPLTDPSKKVPLAARIFSAGIRSRVRRTVASAPPSARATSRSAPPARELPGA